MWSKECESSFKLAKEKLISTDVLAHYDPSLELRLAADASAYGVGAVLSHVMADGEERPIAFASRTLSSAEKIMLRWRKKFLLWYLGSSDTILSSMEDVSHWSQTHKPLTTILGPKKGISPLAAARLQRWALLLSAYRYKIKFRPTQAHANADALSRLPLEQLCQENYCSEPTIFNISQVETLPVTAATLRQQH